jgi:hypothetical protein
MTPNIAIVRISNPHWRGFNLWLPVFLLWIPLVLLSPLLFLVLLAVSIASRIPMGRMIGVFWGVVSSLSGMQVRVSAQGNHVSVRIL